MGVTYKIFINDFKDGFERADANLYKNDFHYRSICDICYNQTLSPYIRAKLISAFWEEHYKMSLTYNDEYEIVATFETEQDYTAFVLRWA